jgi:hypothetical protein
MNTHQSFLPKRENSKEEISECSAQAASRSGAPMSCRPLRGLLTSQMTSLSWSWTVAGERVWSDQKYAEWPADTLGDKTGAFLLRYHTHLRSILTFTGTGCHTVRYEGRTHVGRADPVLSGVYDCVLPARASYNKRTMEAGLWGIWAVRPDVESISYVLSM